MDAEGNRIAWMVIGDWGECTEALNTLAGAMGRWAQTWHPAFVVSVGDNFYPSGVRSVVMEDPPVEESQGGGGAEEATQGGGGIPAAPPPPTSQQQQQQRGGKGGWKKGNKHSKQAVSLERGAYFTAAEFLYWAKAFLRYESLRVPWKVVLGNHDYNGNWAAQLAFTDSKLNAGGIWQMRGDDVSVAPSRIYTWSRNLVDGSVVDVSARASKEEKRAGASAEVQFFAFDAGACQYAVRRVLPDVQSMFAEDCVWLEKECKRAHPLWRILFQHHPLYTGSKGHLSESLCLRSVEYVSDRGERRPGLDLERLLFRLDCDAVFAGHEHMFQCHEAKNGEGKRMLHVGCGATVESSFYKGAANTVALDWHERRSVGFVAAEIVTTATTSTLRVHWVRVNGTIAKTVEMHKALPPQ